MLSNHAAAAKAIRTMNYVSLNLEQQAAVDRLISRSGGIHAVIDHFGWQGGTIHQVRNETIRRLKCTDIAIGKDGELYDLSKPPGVLANG